MLERVGDFHEYMNQLYEVAKKYGLRHFIINTGSSPIAPQQILFTYRTPENEPISGSLVGKVGEDLIYVVKW